MKKVLIASNNAHKVSEIESALDFEGWKFYSLKDRGIVSEPEENADSFEGNARIKAVAAHTAGGCAAIADDSGIAVDALCGAPGVFSARYAGSGCSDSDNNAKLLAALEGVPDAQRSARFVCSLVFIDEDGAQTTAQGTIEGKIGYKLQGNGGFGYDPLFFPLKYGGEKTLAELSQEEKNAISHRGNALRELKARLSAKK